MAVSVHKLNDSKFTEITVDEPDNPSDEKEASRDENEDTEKESEPGKVVNRRHKSRRLNR